MRRILKWLGLAFVIVLVVVIADAWRGFGKRATGVRAARLQRSPEWKDGQFRNPEPLVNSVWGTAKAMFQKSPDVSPKTPLPVQTPSLASPPEVGATWLGHSTTLVDLDGHRVLTDPIWAARSGPFDWIGPQRWFAPPIALADLAAIDAVVISHDHYDHLDHRTIIAMKDWPITFVVPLGIGAHLEYWGVPPDHIRELDWWESTRVRELEIVCVPARHAAGRSGLDIDAKLWSGFALIGPKHRVYYSGDTGLFTAQKEIGKRFGPFDLTMIEVGQYHGAWPDWHIGPEQAVLAHQWVKGRVFLPVHWGAFELAMHTWTEPIERALEEAKAKNVTIVTPRPGERVDALVPKPSERWWPDLPWQRASEAPVISGNVDRAPP